jgi:hypothetical protein
VAELFASTDDAKVIIRWKDIHERLEEAVDALENAADVGDRVEPHGGTYVQMPYRIDRRQDTRADRVSDGAPQRP